MTTPFETAAAFVREREGGFANDPRDRGGATMCGVTQSTYDRYRRAWKLPTRPVRQIELRELDTIYLAYWRDAQADRVAAAGYPALALILFDFGFNSGPGTARLLLQNALGVVSDGKIGPKTLSAVAQLGEQEACRRYLDRRAVYIHRIMRDDPTQRVFYKNWMARCRHCARVAAVTPSALYDSDPLNDADALAFAEAALRRNVATV